MFGALLLKKMVLSLKKEISYKPLVLMLQLLTKLEATFLKNSVLPGLAHITWCNMKQDVLWRTIHCAIIGVTVLTPVVVLALIL